MLGSSNYISPRKTETLRSVSERLGLDVERQVRETDASDTMEGLYIKVEENGIVTERMKYVRAEFLQRMLQSDSHWIDRPIIPNQLKGHMVLS